MAYIPEGHQQYDLLPRCRKRGGEVFEYPGKLLDQIETLIGSATIFPYGFDSYEAYFDTLDIVLQKYSSDKIICEKLILLKTQMRELNRKEEWSVLRYKGPAGNSIMGLTPGKIYYWPTQISNPIYHGVIDNEEFTSYLYPTESEYWEILEDPTGMAYRTIYEGGRGAISIKEHEQIILQFSEEITCE